MRQLILIMFLLCFSPGLGVGQTSMVAQEHYALVSPERAASLIKFAATPEGRSILRRGEETLDRPPHAVPVLHTEGTMPHKGIYDESIEAKKDLPSTLNLALAYRLTRDRRFLASADRYMAAWLDVYRLSLNPIDETSFDAFIVAFDLVRKELPESTRQSMFSFLRRMAEGYLGEASRKGTTLINNWQSHRVKLATLASYSLGDAHLQERAQAAYRAQLAANLRPDGSTFDFEQRDALHYAVYDLEPLTVAALAAREHEQDWYHLESPLGASLGKSLRWLLPFAQGKTAHEEFVRSTVRFDYERREAGLPGFSGSWDPKSSANLYHWAARIDPDFAALAKSLGNPQPWLVVCFPE